MARNTVLSTLLTMLKAQLGQSLTQGVAADDIYAQLLSDKQKWLAGKYDWPFLEARFDIVVPINTQYNIFPSIDTENQGTALNFERPVLVEVFYNDAWQGVDYGIGSKEYNYLNSEQGQAQDPIMRWRWSEDVHNQFENWPINTTEQTLRFTGQRALDILSDPNDTADLDDLMIVLLVAVDLAAKAGMKSLPALQAMAAEQYRAIRAAYPSRPEPVIFGQLSQEQELKRLVPILAVHG